MAASTLNADAQQLIRNIPLWQGGDAVIREAHERVKNDISRAALENLADIKRLLVGYGLEKYISFDLGLFRDLNYYTGMVFEAYTPGLGFPLCGGGRYDNMVAAFGIDCPATGFAFGIERVLLALERQGIDLPDPAKDVYIGWQDGALSAAIAEATRLRQAGQAVELALEPATIDAAKAAQVAKGYAKLLYFSDDHVDEG